MIGTATEQAGKTSWDRSLRGRVAELSGRMSEAAVARHYRDTGRTIAATRWRGGGGEIDLVAREGDCVVVVEVKRARTHHEAAGRITRAQTRRLFAAAAAFVEGEPRGMLTDLRFDVALVDAAGRIEIIENALWD
jgi:putative endonuclease